jgi:RecB family endonuclease NucS
MKKVFLLLTFSTLALFVRAQDDQTTQPTTVNDQREQDIEALKVAFLSKQLDLTPEEAQQFWPVYNEYAIELKQIIRSDPDVLDRDERVLNVRKKYKDQFVKILGPDRLNRLFEAEGRFHQLLIRAMRRQEDNRPMRPMMRRGGD